MRNEGKQDLLLAQPNHIKLFEGRQIRSTWNEEDEQWYFVVEDVVAVLTDSTDPKQYVKRLKLRDPELAKGWVQIVPTLMVQTEGGPQKMRVANAKGLFRIIQSIPSKKAEPIKQWLAKVGAERINQMQDPERSLQQMVAEYKSRLGNKCQGELWLLLSLAISSKRVKMSKKMSKRMSKRNSLHVSELYISY